MLEAKTIKGILIFIIAVSAGILIYLNQTTNIFSDDKNTSNNTPPLITLPPLQLMIQTPSPLPSTFINPIYNFVLKKNSNELIKYLNFITNNNVLDEYNNELDENILNSNLQWNENMNNIITPNETDTNRLAAQFRYFAEFWLNILNINSGFTNVLDYGGIIGKYEFSRNKNFYTAKFNNNVWTWNTNKNYCFNNVNSKRKNNCMGGWTYIDGKCFPPASSLSTCSNYDWKTIHDYPYTNDINSWMNNCNIVNSSNCINPIPNIQKDYFSLISDTEQQQNTEQQQKAEEDRKREEIVIKKLAEIANKKLEKTALEMERQLNALDNTIKTAERQKIESEIKVAEFEKKQQEVLDYQQKRQLVNEIELQKLTAKDMERQQQIVIELERKKQEYEYAAAKKQQYEYAQAEKQYNKQAEFTVLELEKQKILRIQQEYENSLDIYS